MINESHMQRMPSSSPGRRRGRGEERLLQAELDSGRAQRALVALTHEITVMNAPLLQLRIVAPIVAHCAHAHQAGNVRRRPGLMMRVSSTATAARSRRRRWRRLLLLRLLMLLLPELGGCDCGGCIGGRECGERGGGRGGSKKLQRGRRIDQAGAETG